MKIQDLLEESLEAFSFYDWREKQKEFQVIGARALGREIQEEVLHRLLATGFRGFRAFRATTEIGWFGQRNLTSRTLPSQLDGWPVLRCALQLSPTSGESLFAVADIKTRTVGNDLFVIVAHYNAGPPLHRTGGAGAEAQKVALGCLGLLILGVLLYAALVWAANAKLLSDGSLWLGLVGILVVLLGWAYASDKRMHHGKRAAFREWGNQGVWPFCVLGKSANVLGYAQYCSAPEQSSDNFYDSVCSEIRFAIDKLAAPESVVVKN